MIDRNGMKVEARVRFGISVASLKGVRGIGHVMPYALLDLQNELGNGRSFGLGSRAGARWRKGVVKRPGACLSLAASLPSQKGGPLSSSPLLPLLRSPNLAQNRPHRPLSHPQHFVSIQNTLQTRIGSSQGLASTATTHYNIMSGRGKGGKGLGKGGAKRESSSSSLPHRFESRHRAVPDFDLVDLFACWDMV